LNSSERYTAAVRELLVAADAEATALGHGSVTSEHLLLALIAAPLGTAGGVFAEHGWGPERLRTSLLACITESSGSSPTLGARTLDFMQALELAEGEADRRGHYWVDPDHVLLALLSEATSAAELLARLGIMRSAIYVAVEQRMWSGRE
jgi:ATP-dependent Clp protease ATP-binding subunit ClpA